MTCVGLVLYGYCGGYFGRDSYEDKRIEAFGADWLVCRDKNGAIHTTTFETMNERDEFVADYSRAVYSYDEEVKAAWIKDNCGCNHPNAPLGHAPGCPAFGAR